MKEIVITNEFVTGRVIELFPRIYVFEIPDDYERAMLFCRHQEYYESPWDDIRGKAFTITQYQNIYVKRNKLQSFTYPEDWTGFNIPGESVLESLFVFRSYSMFTEYDSILNHALHHIRHTDDLDKPFYVIGVNDINNISVLHHELAHALYHTNPDYKINANVLLDELPDEVIESVTKQLQDMGYADGVINDEIQAYLSTGLIPEVDSLNDIDQTPFKLNLQTFLK